MGDQCAFQDLLYLSFNDLFTKNEKVNTAQCPTKTKYDYTCINIAQIYIILIIEKI